MLLSAKRVNDPELLLKWLPAPNTYLPTKDRMRPWIGGKREKGKAQGTKVKAV